MFHWQAAVLFLQVWDQFCMFSSRYLKGFFAEQNLLSVCLLLLCKPVRVRFCGTREYQNHLILDICSLQLTCTYDAVWRRRASYETLDLAFFSM